jgi:hypothetical protein
LSQTLLEHSRFLFQDRPSPQRARRRRFRGAGASRRPRCSSSLRAADRRTRSPGRPGAAWGPPASPSRHRGGPAPGPARAPSLARACLRRTAASSTCSAPGRSPWARCRSGRRSSDRPSRPVCATRSTSPGAGLLAQFGQRRDAGNDHVGQGIGVYARRSPDTTSSAAECFRPF